MSRPSNNLAERKATNLGAMRFAGKITEWDDDRGFGFVVPNGGGDRAFVHIKSFENRNRRPHKGLLISYQVERDSKGRLNAVAVRQAVRTRRSYKVEFPRKTIAVTFLVFLALGAAIGRIPLMVAAIYVLMSGVTYYLYLVDKSAAQRRAWRTEEGTLHFMSLIGGWPGALIAQASLRHKTKKSEFQAVFWLTVVANLGLLVWLVTSGILDSMSDFPLSLID